MTVGRVIVQFLWSSTMALPAAYCVIYILYSEWICLIVCVCVCNEKWLMMWCQTWNNFLVYFLSFLIFLPPLNGLYRIWKGTPKMLVRSFVFCFLFLLFNRFLFFFSIIMWQTQHNIWQTIKKTKNWPICGDSPSVFWCIGYLSNQNEILLLLFFSLLY